MAQKSSVIKCQKCGYVSNIISDICIKCGARLEKICGECGFANAVEKNYCDQCGGLLALKAQPAINPESGAPKEPGSTDLTAPPPPKEETLAEKPDACAGAVSNDDGSQMAKFQFELQPIQDTVSEKEASFRARPLRTVPDETLPRRQPSMIRDSAPAAPGMPPKPDETPGRHKAKNIYTTLLSIALFAVLAFLCYLIAAPHIPKLSLKITAGSYLSKLAAGRYEDTYEFLSTNSKTACSKEDYLRHNREYYGKIPAWEFRDVKVFAMEPAAAMIQYQLREGTGAWRMDFVSFVKENDKWTRPYIWMLFEPLDLALARQDYPQALFLAQKLYLTDPIDPRTSGYLCAAEFFMGLYDKSAESCQKTILSAKTYPVGFSPEEIFWYKFYYADSLRFVGKFELALDEYGELLGAGGLSMKEQCPLFLSQADAFVQAKSYYAALNSMLKADGVCFGDINRGEVLRRLRFMNGDARTEAISFAQRTKAREDLPAFGELRRRELARISAGLGSKGAGSVPKDTWIAAHIAGPEYRVVLRQERVAPRTRLKEVTDIYTFMVNLWTGDIKLEEGALPR